MNYKVPGVYLEQDPKRIEPIRIKKECIAGFIGFSEKGPLNKGVRIKSFGEFQKIYGSFTDYSYLAYTVYGFFLSGGRECVVARVAHYNEKDKLNSACKSSILVNDTAGSPYLKMTALSEGTWGDYIILDIRYHEAATANITKEITKGNNYIEVDIVEGFEENDVVCLSDANKKEYLKIRKISENKIYLNSKVNSTFDIKDSSLCNIKLNIILSQKNTVEKFLFLSLNPDDERYFIKEINTFSNLVNINILNETLLPQEIYNKNFSGGKNGLMGLTPADFIGYSRGLDDNKGLGILDSVNDISLIVCPDILLFEDFIHNDKDQVNNDIFVVQRAIIDHCEMWSNRFAILDIPRFENLQGLINWRNKFDTKVAAMYYPRIEMLDPKDITGLSSLLVPPSGHIAGVFADKDENEGMYKVAANIFIKGAVGLEKIVDKKEYEIIYPKGINGFKNIPGRGIKIWGARTLSSDISWRYINVRRTFSMIQEALKEGTSWAVFEQNQPGLRKSIVRHVTAFMRDIWRDGYLQGNVPEEAFFVKCDNELNPPENIEKGIITVEIGIAIAKPAEFLIIKLKGNLENSMVLLENV